TPCNDMCAVTSVSGGIARANSVPGCNREADYQQPAQHPMLKSAPMGDTPHPGKGLTSSALLQA
ncbi:MAG: hypothetical protein ACXVBU_10185, partial [Ktedonobacteraceae bacterium]